LRPLCSAQYDLAGRVMQADNKKSVAPEVTLKNSIILGLL